jgi:hypothetical protein
MRGLIYSIKNIASLLLVAGIVSSCKEKIDLPLKDQSGKLVIEGNITDGLNPAVVLVSKTTNYKDTLFFDGQSGAIVVIEHNGVSDTLPEIARGIYSLNALKSIANMTYNLTVNFEGKRYTASSTAPLPVAIDSGYTVPSLRGNGVRPVAAFRDPAGVTNYYKGDLYKNGEYLRTFEVADDRLTDGKEKTVRFSGERDYTSGEVIRIVLNSLDQGAYQYFYTLSVNSSAQSAAPANPTSNISGDVLGYFSAHTETEISFLIP